MRENCTYGSEGGEARAFPTPIIEREPSMGPRLRGCRKRGDHGVRDSIATLKTVSLAKARAHTTSAHACYRPLPRAALAQGRRFFGQQ